MPQNTIHYQGAYVPSKLVCIGRNYSDHIAEMGSEPTTEMVVFNKPNSALSDSLHAEHGGEALHYEAELCFLVEHGQYKACTVGFDLTKRAKQNALKDKGLPWERCKAFNHSAVLGDFVALPKVLDKVYFTLHIESELRQHGRVLDMLFKPKAILENLAPFMQLDDGDIVMTGTPGGVGVVEAGKRFELALYDDQDLLLKQAWLAQA